MPRKTKHNKLTDEASLAAVNLDNKRLISDYIEYLRSTQKSPNTIDVYKNDLDIAMVWCLKYNRNKAFTDWTKRDVMSFQNWLVNTNGNSPARVRRIKATLSSMSNFIEAVLDDDYPEFRNIIHKIESPVAQPVREKTVLSEEQIQMLLNYLVERKEYKKACMVSLAVCSGRRKAELCRFKVKYFVDENLVCNNALYKTSEKVKTKGRGDGKYMYCFVLAKKFKPYFDLWIKQREELGIESEWLFPSDADPSQQMPISLMNSWASSFSRILNIDWYWHCVRHAFVTSLVKAGFPDAAIQQIVGWESADMCRVYTDLDAEEQLSDYFKDGDICVMKRASFDNV